MGIPNFTSEVDGFGWRRAGGNECFKFEVLRIASCVFLLIASSLTGEVREGAQWAMNSVLLFLSEVGNSEVYEHQVLHGKIYS